MCEEGVMILDRAQCSHILMLILLEKVCMHVHAGWRNSQAVLLDVEIVVLHMQKSVTTFNLGHVGGTFCKP